MRSFSSKRCEWGCPAGQQSSRTWLLVIPAQTGARQGPALDGKQQGFGFRMTRGAAEGRLLTQQRLGGPASTPPAIQPGKSRTELKSLESRDSHLSRNLMPHTTNYGSHGSAS